MKKTGLIWIGICLFVHAVSPAWAGDPAWIVAHRGASKDAPENTLPAFELAWEQGADAIEGDFRLTRDGQVVCVHDDRTKRTAGTDLSVAQSTLAELKALDAGSWFDPRYAGTRIPTLAEVLATVPPQGKIFIEIKCGIEIIPALLAGIGKSDLRSEQIVVICFKAEVLRTLKEAAPHLKTSWLVGFKKDDAGTVTPSRDEVFDTLERIAADGLSTNSRFVDGGLIRRVQAEGRLHHVWTINDPETARRFRDWQTSSITTDVPGRMRKL